VNNFTTVAASLIIQLNAPPRISQNKRGNRRKMLMRSVLLLLAFVSFSGQSETIKENYAFAVLVSLSTH
jgi:hypothetical protein